MSKRARGGKIGAKSQDFSGQDSGYPSASPAAEARTNRDARPKLSFVPTIDDPSKRKAISTIISSDAIERRLGKR